RERFKAERAAEMAAVLALSAVRNNDRVGLLLFSDHVEHVVPPKKGKRHVLRIIRDVLAFKPKGTGTDIPAALDYAGRLLGHRAVIFVLSDFAVLYPPDEGPESETFARFEKSLRLVGKRHDVVAVNIRDEAEQQIPNVGLLVLRDPETGERVAVDTSRADLRARYHGFMTQERNAVRRTFRRNGVDEVEIGTAGSFVKPLLAFFHRRERAKGR
ncbi:MAG TPA: VWA domain-containing protein, partial [Longimicrobiales bacterium]|nr:VWA domain-containing protein [Longimicrobiales bacterium]